jgi:hypothetical protein
MITFADREMTKKAIGFLAGRFSCKVLKSAEIMVPEESLAALALENFRFSVIGKPTYEQEIEAFRAPTASKV